MEYKEMKEILDDYNWDDGFNVPKQIISDANCDLALALEVFYLGDGFEYFDMTVNNIGETSEWFYFISDLYDNIRNGKYKKSEHHYKIPLSKVQRYKLRKKNILEIFLTDL